MDSLNKLAKLLRTTEEVVLVVKEKMEKITGKKGVLEEIIEENDKKVNQKLKELNLTKNSKAEEVYRALFEKAKDNDKALYKHFRRPDLRTATGCQTLIHATYELTGGLEGFFLKKEKAVELLRLNPPRNIMAILGYGSDVDKLLLKEDPLEIFCALRFAEDHQWLNEVFFRAYQDLKKEDFEHRSIQVRVLPERWMGVGQKFLKKKLHHTSHLKELGVVFIIPVPEIRQGETLYLFFIILHYLNEVKWYSQLFEMYSKRNDFAQKLIHALKNEVTCCPLPDHKKMSWRIAPQYLAKENPYDSRLMEPHLSPEAWFYYLTYQSILKLGRRFPELGLDFWESCDSVGDLFSSETGEEKLISFDLIDNGISLLKQSSFESKYLYHQQEALWNKIFIKFMNEEILDRVMKEEFEKGYVSFDLKTQKSKIK